MPNEINTRDLAIMTEQAYYMVDGEYERLLREWKKLNSEFGIEIKKKCIIM